MTEQPSGRHLRRPDFYLTRPVAQATPEIHARINVLVNSYIANPDHVPSGEHAWVYDPFEDTDQNDPVGVRICRDNCSAIRVSREVLHYHHPLSRGSAFDAGMTLMLNRQLYLLNPGDAEADTDSSDPALASYSGLLLRMARNTRDDIGVEQFERMIDLRESFGVHKVRGHDSESPIALTYTHPRDFPFLFETGLAFASGRPIYLTNPEAAMAQVREGMKSLENVLAALDREFRDPAKHQPKSHFQRARPESGKNQANI